MGLSKGMDKMAAFKFPVWVFKHRNFVQNLGIESDEEIRRVPEIGVESAGTSAFGRDTRSVAGPDRVQAAGEGQRKRGRSPADKESKRLKR